MQKRGDAALILEVALFPVLGIAGIRERLSLHAQLYNDAQFGTTANRS